MDIGTKIKFLKDIQWGDIVLPKGTRGAIERIGSAGIFIKVKGYDNPVYIFRDEIMKLLTVV